MGMVQIFDLLPPVRQVCRGCPTSTLINAYVRGARRLCGESRWLRSTLLGSTVAPVSGVGTAVYNLGSDTYNDVKGIDAIAIVGHSNPLTPKASNEWNDHDSFDKPEFYEFMPGQQIGLHPTPDQVYQLTITLVLQPKRGSNAIDETLLVSWEEALIDGALSTLHAIKGTPWYDEAKAAQKMLMFNSAIARARSDVGANYNAGALPTSRIGPRSSSQRTRSMVI